MHPTILNPTKEQEEELKQWARDHYWVGTPIFPTWHPIVQEECRVINEEANIQDD